MASPQKNKSPIGAFNIARVTRGPLSPYPIEGADCTARNKLLTDQR